MPEQLLHVAIEHRLMHAETFAYILHNLAYERKVGQAFRPAGLLARTRYLAHDRNPRRRSPSGP